MFDFSPNSIFLLDLGTSAIVALIVNVLLTPATTLYPSPGLYPHG